MPPAPTGQTNAGAPGSKAAPALRIEVGESNPDKPLQRAEVCTAIGVTAQTLQLRRMSWLGGRRHWLTDNPIRHRDRD